MKTLAAIATQRRRQASLVQSLASLRPQVDRIHVYLNGFDSVPHYVRDYADEWIVRPKNEGAERKLHWAGAWDGVYLSCDDDFVYPPDYVATMVEHVRRFDGRAVVTSHGRALRQNARVMDHTIPELHGAIMQDVPEGRFVNYGGTGVMAWDASKIKIPTNLPGKNMADMQVSRWCQENRVPIWIVPHTRTWIRPLAISDPNGIFHQSRITGHASRNQALNEHSRRFGGWHIHRIEETS